MPQHAAQPGGKEDHEWDPFTLGSPVTNIAQCVFVCAPLEVIWANNRKCEIFCGGPIGSKPVD